MLPSQRTGQHAEGGHLEVLHARTVQYLQRKQRPSSRNELRLFTTVCAGSAGGLMKCDGVSVQQICAAGSEVDVGRHGCGGSIMQRSLA